MGNRTIKATGPLTYVRVTAEKPAIIAVTFEVTREREDELFRLLREQKNVELTIEVPEQ